MFRVRVINLTERTPQPGSCTGHVQSSIDEESITDALHRLTMRQLTRQRTRLRHSRLAWITAGDDNIGARGRNGASTTTKAQF